MKTKVIVGDVHGAWGDFTELLKLCGVVDANGNKRANTHVIQLGDFPTLGYNVQEAAGHQEALDLVDEALLGNHCAAALGITSHDGFEDADMAAVHQVQSNFFHKKYKVATSVGDWLITHAGLSPHLYFTLKYEGVPANLIANDLNGRFDQYMELGARSAFVSGYDIFSHNGGILWLRYDWLMRGYTPEPHVELPQIRGHCHYTGPLLSGCGKVWNLAANDCIPALVTKDDGQTFTLITQPILGTER